MKLSQADRKYYGIKPIIHPPQRPIPSLTIVLTFIPHDKGSGPVEIDYFIERPAPLRNVAGIFIGIITYVHGRSI
jgi:hypothetical protein